MRHFIVFSNILLYFFFTTVYPLRAERIEWLPYGNLDSWTVRFIKESKLIGGQTKMLYAVAEDDTIKSNAPFVYGCGGNIWSNSNAYAKVAGIEKASLSTYPERRGNGWCARMDSKLDGVVVLGMINVKVQVSGTLFTGITYEPVTLKGANDPYSVVEMGIPFTKHPSALILDYKALVEDVNVITYAKATPRPKEKQGRDCAEMYVYLQRRWEDESGNIIAYRVGTGYERIYNSVETWQNGHKIPIRWGDISKQPNFKDYEGLNKHSFKAKNSKNKMVNINEIGYSSENPTHMIIMLSAGSYEAFVGHIGNSLWVDNIGLLYD